MSCDAGDLLDKVKSGVQLSGDELSFVRNSLNSQADNLDIHNLSRVLALSVKNNVVDVRLVEKYFDFSLDDWGLQGVIYALCDYWGLAEKYLDNLVRLANLRQWSNFPSAASAAISTLGKYMHSSNNADVLEQMLSIYETDFELYKQNSSEFELQHICMVYQAINRAVRGEAARLDIIGFSFPKDVKRGVLVDAREMVKQKR